MMKILLLNCPYKGPIIRDNYCCFTSKSGYIWPPVDLLYLSGMLKGRSELKVIDAVAEKINWRETYKIIDSFDPEVIIALTGTVSYQVDLNGLKALKNRKIYLIGNTPCFRPEFFLKKYSFVGGIIHNFFNPSIVDYLIGKNTECESISYRNKDHSLHLGKINCLKPMSVVRLAKPPQYHLFPIGKYSTPIIRNKPMMTAMTSFGCPFNCKFCIASALTYYRRDIRDLKKEFDEMKKSGVKEIFFEDSTFNTYIPYLGEICNLLIREKYGFSWSANVHSFNLSEPLLKLMKKAGCHTVQIGVESGNPGILKEYAPSKGLTRLENSFDLCKKVGIRTLGYFIIGFPKDNVETAQETIDFAKKLDPNFASFSIMTPDYGTRLYEEVAAKKMFTDNGIKNFDSSEKAIIKNKNFPRKNQDEMLKKAYRDFYGRPSKLLSYLLDYKYTILYVKNGLRLLAKKIL